MSHCVTFGFRLYKYSNTITLHDYNAHYGLFYVFLELSWSLRHYPSPHSAKISHKNIGSTFFPACWKPPPPTCGSGILFRHPLATSMYNEYK
jgi:hypothetical protein